jgi:hypothetical protein
MSAVDFNVAVPHEEFHSIDDVETKPKAVSEVTPAYKSVVEEADARDGLIPNRIFLAKRVGFQNPAEPSDFPCVIGI